MAAFLSRALLATTSGLWVACRLNQRTLRSQIDGVVVERLLYPGEYRNEQTPILTLAEIDKLRVEVFLPTILYNEIHVGGKAEVEARATYREGLRGNSHRGRPCARRG